MRAGHVFLASFAVCPLAGWPLLAHPSYRCFSPACRFALSGAAGAVLVSWWMTVFALAGLSWRLPSLFGLAAAAGFLMGRRLAEKDGASGIPPGEPSLRPSEKLAMVVTAIAVVWAFIAAASGAATSADLILFWGPKAQAFAAARTIDAAFLRQPFLEYLHVSYPPLVTNLFAFATIVAGRFPWGAATLTFPLLLAALALAVPGALRLTAPRRTAWACAALIVSAFGFLGNALDVAGNGEAFLWLFETLAMAILVGPAGRRQSGQLLAGLLLAGAATTKVEGLPFVLAAAVFFLAVRRRELRLRRAAFLLLTPTALCLGAWFAFGAARGVFIGYESYGPTFEIHWTRLPLVLTGIGSALWSAGDALPFLLPLLALIASPRPSRLAAIPVGVAFVLALFFVFAYLHGDPDPSLWIVWSAGRVFSPVLALFAIAGVCRGTDNGESVP